MRHYIAGICAALLSVAIIPAGYGAGTLNQAAQQLDRLVLYDPSYEKIAYRRGCFTGKGMFGCGDPQLPENRYRSAKRGA